MNLYKFQNRYLKSKLTIHLHTFMKIELDKKITKSLINYLTKCCQSAMINDKKIKLKLDPKRKENKNLDKDKLEKCLQIFIDCEKIHMPNIRNLNKKIEERLYDLIKYNKYMISFLERVSYKRFDLLPRINLGVHYVHLGSKFLSTIYNEWKNLKVPIKKSEQNYEQYYKEMFNFAQALVRNKLRTRALFNRISLLYLYKSFEKT